ncbi:hypothetical protein RMATCC62417_05831 [Rhizopus microsporus]|nr:hypothetical protein RMATCC62417_05831 [Rhizopus microsporus]
MKRPVPSNDIKDFNITQKDCTKHQIYKKLAALPVASWSDISELVKVEFENTSSKSTQAEDSHKRFIKGLATVHSKLIRHPSIQSYALAVSCYLKSLPIKTAFVSEFNTKLEDIKAKKAKKNLNEQTRAISQAEVYLEDRERLTRLHKQIDSPSSFTEAPSTTAATPTESEDHLSSTGAMSSLPISKTPSIKDTIFNYAAELHELYQQEKKLSNEQLKSMSIGLSCIVDLADEDKEGTLRAFLKETVWKQLYSKYLKRSKLNLTVVPAALVDKWNYAVLLYHQSNGVRNTKKYLSYLQSKQDITDTDTRIYELFFEIFSLLESKSFILNKSNASKVAERDYLYQLWSSLFTKLFSIHGNIIRIKTSETVPDNTTISKMKLYKESDHIIGFKVDLRFILDLEHEEIDIGCGEGCLEAASDDKLRGDTGKLLREGKEMEMSVREILLNDDDDAKSKIWLLQITGTTCHFFTIQATNHHYHINVPQFSLLFPDSFLNKDSISALTHLFTFRDNIEALASKLKNIVQWRKAQFLSEEEIESEWCMTPERPYHAPESTWFAPPRRNQKSSRIPHRTVYESDVESADDDDAAQDDEDEPDIHGFIHTKDGWLCTKTRVAFTTHPCL